MTGNQKHILYSVLNWGLGHATRSIPIIQELIHLGVKVSLAGEGSSMHLLRSEFPKLSAYELKGINISYPERTPFSFYLFSQLPAIYKAIHHEHIAFQKLVNSIQPDATISDNRYGAYAPGIPSVILCHQLQLKVPFLSGVLEPLLFNSYKKLFRPFSQIWVPDHEGNINLTGTLSHTERAIKALHPVFIGPLSRLKNVKAAACNKVYEVLVILSGPEPQRTYFEKLMRKDLQNSTRSVLMLTGQPQDKAHSSNKHLTVVPNLTPEELKFHFIHSKYIICRAGHSTMMDLCAFQRTAVVIPTPGQTEQEYLSKRLSELNHFVSFPQHNFNIEEGINKLPSCTPIHLEVNEHFTETVRDFVLKLK